MNQINLIEKENHSSGRILPRVIVFALIIRDIKKSQVLKIYMYLHHHKDTRKGWKIIKVTIIETKVSIKANKLKTQKNQ